jgi:hypothetical protein
MDGGKYLVEDDAKEDCVKRKTIRGRGPGLAAAGALLLGLAACEGADSRPPEVGSNPWYPRPTPCLVDAHGAVSKSGDRQALCCPEGFVFAGALRTGCRRGECCWVGDDMDTPPLPPESPAGFTVPPS